MSDPEIKMLPRSSEIAWARERLREIAEQEAQRLRETGIPSNRRKAAALLAWVSVGVGACPDAEEALGWAPLLPVEAA